MPALSKAEAQVIIDLRVLPEDQRTQYASRIHLLAQAYKTAAPDERVLATGFTPERRPKTKAKG
jgi:hypothetical protein